MKQIYQTPIYPFISPESPTFSVTNRNFNRQSRDEKSKGSSKGNTWAIVGVVIIFIIVLAGAVGVPLLYTTVILKTTSTTTTTATTTPVLIWNATGTTIAGSPSRVPGTNSSLLNIPYGIALDPSNALYIADYSNNRIQKWAAGATSGITVAGQENGTRGNSSTELYLPVGIVLDSNNNMYFSDRGNHRVMYWANGASSGTVIAGITGSRGNASNQFNSPSGLVIDWNTRTMYVADTSNHRIMQYLSGATSGTVVAGGNGAGTGSTQLNGPYCFVIDSATNSFIIPNYAGNNVVRWVIGATTWTLLAGSATGISGSTSTLLFRPLSVVLDPWSNMYITDVSNHRVQMFPYGQSTGITIAGITGVSGTNATQLYLPYWLTLDSQLNLYVADTYNYRIQKFQRT